MLIEWLITGQSDRWVEENFANGGYAYDTYARRLLRERYRVEVTYVPRGRSASKPARAWQWAVFATRMRRLKLRGDIVVRDFFSTIFCPQDRSRRYVSILHHFDTRCTPYKSLYRFLGRCYLRRLAAADAVVVVSEYWRRVLERAGVSTGHVIYNSYDLAQFDLSDEELRAFRRSLGARDGRPLIYLGNARPEKGFREAYAALRSLDADFVTTGRERTDLPVIHVFLSYRDYLKLLASCDLVITMSLFDEGWCRTAHEAMLCGTPVVGSGRGGMGELLTKGGQRICPSFDKLLPTVREVFADRSLYARMSRDGRAYASQFDLSYFANRWHELIEELGRKRIRRTDRLRQHVHG